MAGLSVTAMTLLLSLPAIAVSKWLGWLPRLQLLPAIMAGEVLALGLTGLIAPYGIFARFVTVGVMHEGEPSVALVVWAVALFAFVVCMTAFCGRWWCNQVCPVGTFLGFFSRFSVFRPRIDGDRCVKCGLCAKACDKGVIEATAGKSVVVDSSMCVACFKCKGSCRKGALSWR